MTELLEFIQMLKGPMGGALALAYAIGAGSAWAFFKRVQKLQVDVLKSRIAEGNARIKDLIAYVDKVEKRLYEVEDDRVSIALKLIRDGGDG